MIKLKEKLHQLAKDIDIPTASIEQVIGTVENNFYDGVVVPRGFLEAAECPDINCDKNGIVAQQISESEWEPMQCQWCHEKEAMLQEAMLKEAMLRGLDSDE